MSSADIFVRDAVVQAKINAKLQREKNLNWFRWGLTVAALLAAPSGWIAWAKYPRIDTRVDFVPIAEDGTPLMALRDEEMPPEARKQNIQNSLINYVMRRESFNKFEVDKNYDVVSRLSSKDVREEYQRINEPKTEGSQWKTYGEDGWVKVEFDSMEDLTSITGYVDVPPAYSVRYCRQVKRKDRLQPDRPELWAVTVAFKADVKGYDSRIVRAYNPGKIQVTNYGRPEPVGPLKNDNGTQRMNSCREMK